MNLFDAALKMKRIDEFKPLLARAVEKDPGHEEMKIIHDAIQDLGDEIYFSERGLAVGQFNPKIEEANKLLEDGDHAGASKIYLEVNEEEPNAQAFCGMGIISYYQGSYDDAFKLFLESIKINPVDVDTFKNFFDAAEALGKTEQAKKVLEIYQKELPIMRKEEFSFDNLRKK